MTEKEKNEGFSYQKALDDLELAENK